MKIGIIGGTGLEQLEIFDTKETIAIETAYGQPSSTVLKAKGGGHELFILSRHGRNHSITPTQVNNKANIAAMEKLGVDIIIATTACGSLREEIGIGHLVIPDQFIDFTRHRAITYFDSFEQSGPQHIAMPDPFDKAIRELMASKAKEASIAIHQNATVITIEGPRFSTRAESRMFRTWGADIINMSTAPEVILANEKKIPYAALAISTDYDSWREDGESANWEDILKVFKKRTEVVKELLQRIISAL